MPKVKGPDMMVLEADSLLASPWLPTSRVMEPYDWQDVFGNGHPVEIDLGSGDGGFILDRARRHPQRNFLAVERLLGRARKITKRIVRDDLRNLKVLRLESFYVVKWLCPPDSLDVVHIMFPDPWPKKRHHKRRLIQPHLLSALGIALSSRGTVRFSTDHEEYSEWARAVWQGSADWKELPMWDFEEDAPSEFQLLWQSEGKLTHRLHYQINSSRVLDATQSQTNINST